MRPVACVLAALAVTFAASVARATVTEPNGLAVPIDSSPEVQLYTLFQQRGESINWQTDAHTTPERVLAALRLHRHLRAQPGGLPLRARLVQRHGHAAAGERSAPARARPTPPVGTTFNGTVIKNDPNYTGGVVGFALIGGETHYTNDAYDTVCTSCSPTGSVDHRPHVRVDRHAQRLLHLLRGRRDELRPGWNNDGDFNDDVYFVTGISCLGGGQPCDTGKPGICAAGLTQCAASGVTCQELNPPAPTETCNGLDDNCDGQVDEGNPCPEEYVCDKGTCVKDCAGDEFPCQVPLVCNLQGYCVDPSCENVTCPSGEVCKSGTCKAPCDGVTCPYPQTCLVGKCVDPCASVTCGNGEVCEEGVCVTSCSCQPCPQGKACDATSGQCVDPTCVSVDVRRAGRIARAASASTTAPAPCVPAARRAPPGRAWTFRMRARRWTPGAASPFPEEMPAPGATMLRSEAMRPPGQRRRSARRAREAAPAARWEGAAAGMRCWA